MGLVVTFPFLCTTNIIFEIKSLKCFWKKINGQESGSSGAFQPHAEGSTGRLPALSPSCIRCKQRDGLGYSWPLPDVTVLTRVHLVWDPQHVEM